MYKMVVTPNPILLATAKPVEKFDKKLKDIVEEMKQTLDATFDPVGVGLAAPQVGISLRIFLSKPKEDGKTEVFINPEILGSSKDDEVPHFNNSKKVESKKPKRSKGRLLEGCLSVPNIWGNVLRKKEIRVSFQDITGKKHVKNVKGFPAIIIQHELDHLNGVLFTTHVLAQKETLYRSYKNPQGEDEFEEMNV
ncbi:MAG TPA: peptide deformylase [Patescibacteria group bacterium]|nr:peptide deformylase [Patescibacteria group bacterium]